MKTNYNIIVVIATKDRRNELGSLTIESLKKQNYHDFLVLVIDASENNDTKNLVYELNDERFNYLKAPRVGLSKQRNDAIAYIKKKFSDIEVVVFLDDDVILSYDAIEGLIESYRDESVFSVGIPICAKKEKKQFLIVFLKLFFLNFVFKNRYITKYAYQFQVNGNEKNSICVNWLSGCGMSYRINCFDFDLFDERLCTFGGYSLCEDSEFSSRVYKKYKGMILSKHGNLKHIRSTNDRLNYENMAASLVYNRKILFNTLNSDSNRLCYFLNSVFFKINQFYVLKSFKKQAKRNGQTSLFKNGVKKAKIIIKNEKL